VDRRLSNQGIDIDAAPRHFVPYVVRVGMPWKIMSKRLVTINETCRQ
jgi:hypothetical protein